MIKSSNGLVRGLVACALLLICRAHIISAADSPSIPGLLDIDKDQRYIDKITWGQPDGDLKLGIIVEPQWSPNTGIVTNDAPDVRIFIMNTSEHRLDHLCYASESQMLSLKLVDESNLEIAKTDFAQKYGQLIPNTQKRVDNHSFFDFNPHIAIEMMSINPKRYFVVNKPGIYHGEIILHPCKVINGNEIESVHHLKANFTLDLTKAAVESKAKRDQ
jgi:hypothetical protein